MKSIIYYMITLWILIHLMVLSIAAIQNNLFKGKLTTYQLSKISNGNCNLMKSSNYLKDKYVGLNKKQWDNYSKCGQCALVTCPKCKNSNKRKLKTIVHIVDQCPGCNYGDLDVSYSLYKTITGETNPGVEQIEWTFTSCPPKAVNYIDICLKEGSNSNWIAIQPINTIIPVYNITLNNNQKTSRLDGAYYFYSQMKQPVNLNKLDISLKSIHGEIINNRISIQPGQCVSFRKQFSRK